MTNPKCKVCGAPELVICTVGGVRHTDLSVSNGLVSEADNWTYRATAPAVSEQALEMAMEIRDRYYDRCELESKHAMKMLVGDVENALQKLMNERDAYREHWDGCAGAEAAINDLRQRAEAAEK